MALIGYVKLAPRYCLQKDLKMRLFSVFSALFLAISLSMPAQAADLEFPASGFVAEAEWVSGPVVGEESILKITWADARTGERTNPSNFRVSLWMPHHGHGSSPTRVEQISAGIYRVRDMYFTMDGQWDVRVRVKNGDATDEKVFSVEL